MTATPRPWRVRETGTLQVWGPGKRWVATVMQPDADNGLAPTDPEARANAALIVRAVNAHDELVALVQQVVAQKNANTRAMAKASPSGIRDARALRARIKE